MTMRILVLGHDAFPAGAQLALLHLLRAVRTSGGAEVTVLLNEGGDLLSEYAEVAPTSLWHGGRAGTRRPSPAQAVRRRLDAAIPELYWILRRPARRRLLTRLTASGFDLIHANSVASLPLVQTLGPTLRLPVVCHVHELEMSIRRFCGVERFSRFQRHVAGYIAASEAVRANRLANHGVSGDRIDTIHESIPITPDRDGRDRQTAGELRRQLGIAEDALVVGGSGTLDWRKAPDIFLMTAAAVARSLAGTPVHFIWVGGKPEGREIEQLRHDTGALGLQGRVHFVGRQARPGTYFQLFDVFFLSSREDPFPLVCLEVAALAIPIVCFAGAGGTPEFVRDDAGAVAPYLDVRMAADRITGLLASGEQRLAMGRRAQERVWRDHDITSTTRRFLAVWERYCGRSGA
jgi:glycosyltransferase involved in cell wall biosynthesis